MKAWGLAAGAAVVTALSVSSAQADGDDVLRRLEALERAQAQALLRERAKDERIEELEAALADAKGEHDGHSGHGGHDHGGGDLYTREISDGVVARFSGIFADVSAAAGQSTARGEELLQLQGGDHDPRENGFTLRSVDLSVAGGIDPFVDGFANTAIFIDPEGETVVELEEAFLQTQEAFTGPIELRAGQYFTEFGISNPTHVHDEIWLDQPFALTRFFGPDGLRGTGARAAFRANGFEVLGGLSNARGETAASFFSSDELFEELPIGNITFDEEAVENRQGIDDLLYNVRVSQKFGLGEGVDALIGASFLIGPNASGPDARTFIVGGHAAASAKFGSGVLTVQGEGLYRNYEIDDANPDFGLTGDELTDFGFYAQALYAFDWGVGVGVRGELGFSGEGDSVGGTENDPFRSDRTRISPLVNWAFAPGARATLQYNYDDIEAFEDETQHSVWVGLDFSIGGGRRAELNSQTLHSHDHGGGHDH